MVECNNLSAGSSPTSADALRVNEWVQPTVTGRFVMKFCSIVALALLVALAAGSTARADCAYKPFDFHPEKNDGVVVESIVDSGSSCTHNFAEGPGYKFTGITFVREPESGKLVKAGANRFVYTPNKGFTGKDVYLFKICAIKGTQTGCSTVAFVAEVR
jgi:hypothetical protein